MGSTMGDTPDKRPGNDLDSMGIEKTGVKRGSRVIPALLLAITLVAFIAYELIPEELADGAGQKKGFVWILFGAFAEWARQITNDFPVVLKSQFFTVSILALYALIPGVFGLIYRRAFTAWFVVSFALLYLVQWVARVYGVGSLTPHILLDLENKDHEAAVQFVQVLLLVGLLFFRLRRHSSAAIDGRTKMKNALMAVVLIAVAAGWAYLSSSDRVTWWEFGAIASLLLIGGLILWQSLTGNSERETRSKNIVLCLDGTWNQPGTKDFGYLAETNVYKLFKLLKGGAEDADDNASQCKRYRGPGGAAHGETRQIAFYYHGVGNKIENSELGQLFGGAFGMGASAIVERAYLDVARVYKPGDRIFIFGFSRGAAISRLVAGAIGLRGFPVSMWTLRLFGRHWVVQKSAEKIKAQTADNKMRGSQHKHQDPTDVPVEVLGCWDTVGSFGISKNFLGIPFQQINLLKDLSVSLCVKRAYHMVALDEMRDAFEPTLMEPDPLEPERIIEVWFSGNHSNVGGGYATDKLSNVTLDFLLRHISSGYALKTGQTPGNEDWGVLLSARRGGSAPEGAEEAGAPAVEPDPRGRIRHSAGGAYEYAARTLPLHAVIHDEVFNRMRDAVPVYAPDSVFNLNKKLVAKRKAVHDETGHLHATHSLDEKERDRIRTWSDKKLSITKWSQYLEVPIAPGVRIEDGIKPEEELSNT